MSNDRQQGRRDEADELFIQRAASWLRDNSGRSVGLASDQDAYALATLLEVLAAELPHLSADVRRKTVDGCRELLGELAEDRPKGPRAWLEARPDAAGARGAGDRVGFQ